MEVSAPVKILEGNSEVLGVTIGTVPGSGECAVISSSSAINLYSMVEKNVTATWAFPANKQECITCPAYLVNDNGYFFYPLEITCRGLVACQGETTILHWKSSSPSAKSFTTSKVFFYFYF